MSVPDLDERLDEIEATARDIVSSISEKLKDKDDKIFEIISNTYFEYKNQLQIIKELVVYKEYRDGKTKTDNQQPKSKSSKSTENDPDLKGKEIREIREKKEIEESTDFKFIKDDKKFQNLLKKENKIRKNFHGNRDFYYIIKGIAYELENLEEDEKKVAIIIRYIERNFGGIEYEIDIDLDINLEGMNTKIELIKRIFNDLNLNYNQKFKLNSVFLFKELYNIVCERLDKSGNLKINKDDIMGYNVNLCINDNIRDIKARYLLLGIEPSLTTLINQNIKLQNELLTITLYDGSPFIEDNNKEYRFRKINEIQEDARENKLIIIENLNQIHPFLFDLYNMNYIIKDEKKFVRICYDNFNEQLTEVNENFRIIILVDKYFINQCELALLNRLEKMILPFDKLLDNDIKESSKDIIDEIIIQSTINNYNHEDINFSLKNLLINCGNEEIQGLIYCFINEFKKIISLIKMKK